MKISIIGTSGRTSSTPKGHALTEDTFDEMVELADNYISSFLSEINKEKKDIILVSGGSAWSDHVAVYLFLYKGYPKLHIYGPCALGEKQFYDTGNVDWRTNPGGTLNYYFKKFNAVRGIDAFQELNKAIKKGATYEIIKGFHPRNKQVAKSDFLIAFSFGKDEPTDGGTHYTWSLCSSPKHHFSLLNMTKKIEV